MQHRIDLAPVDSTGHCNRKRKRTTALRRYLILALPLGSFLLTAPATASEGAIDYRQHVMAAVGGHMQAIADIVRQKVSHEGHIGLHADALAKLAGIADTLFPEGSQGGDTLPAAWQKPDDFARRMADFKSATADFAAAVDSGNATGPAFQKVGQSCKSCHDNYRAK
jgi:cytochrome c556